MNLATLRTLNQASRPDPNFYALFGDQINRGVFQGATVHKWLPGS